MGLRPRLGVHIAPHRYAVPLHRFGTTKPVAVSGASAAQTNRARQFPNAYLVTV